MIIAAVGALTLILLLCISSASSRRKSRRNRDRSTTDPPSSNPPPAEVIIDPRSEILLNASVDALKLDIDYLRSYTAMTQAALRHSGHISGPHL